VARRPESANTEEPRASGRTNASAWIETKEVRLHLARLLHADVQRQEEVGVAREQRAHVRLAVDQRLEALRDHQRDVLLARAEAPERTRVFPAVPGIDHDDRKALDLRRLAAAAPDRRGNGWQRRDRPSPTPRSVPRADPAARADKIEDEPVAIFRDRLQRKRLRVDACLEVEHEAQHARPEAADAQLLDVRSPVVTLPCSSASAGLISAPSKSSTRRSGSLSANSVYLSSFFDSIVTRV
jgi:hypothetical protein